MAMSLKSTPVPTKRKTRLNKTEDIVLPYDLEDISRQPRIRSINHIMTHDPFVENLSRPDGCKSDKVTVPEYMSVFINNKDLPEYRFPWGKRDIVIGRSFWLSLSCLNISKSGWLTDQLKIRTGVVTFYDSLGWASGSKRRWWRRMKKVLPEKLTLYLLMHGIFDSNGISVDHYKITYNYASVPFQASLYGDCGIWVKVAGSLVIFVYEEIKCGVLLPKNISQKRIVRYVRKKFNVEDNKELLLSYNIGSNSFNIIDEDDVDFFLKAVLESGDVVMSVFIKSTEKIVEVTPSKPLDIDLNIPLFREPVTHEWMKKSLNYLPPAPHVPILDLKSINTSHHGVKFSVKTKFADKEACMYEIGVKCITEGYEYKVVRSCSQRDVTRVYRPKDIINDLNIEFNIDVSYKRAWKGKQLALKSNQGDPISSFAQLPYYCYNLKLANENTVTHIDTDHEGRFKMLFIAFGAAVRI
ncbi:hypothetical protein Tco_1018362 [Tanacetum coccineum]|uniref:Uncharacterized protein n=1 Tax=Tanacetum coccineum TaxID=301880 RepID=A0ABQ5FW45_9ASTR